LTRFCKDAKVVITGDPNQSDLPAACRGDFIKVVRAMSENPDIGIVYFDRSDIQRHPLVAWIEETFENMDKPRSLEEIYSGNSGYYDGDDY
jgi:phosphate starvation-inducible PhoH-like protein